MHKFPRSIFLLALAVLTVISSSFAAQAHFNHFQPRVIHIVEKGDGVHVYIRVPLPLELLPKDWRGVDAGNEIAYSQKVKLEKEGWDYKTDFAAFRAGSQKFADMLAAAYSVSIDGQEISEKQIPRILISPYHLRRTVRSPSDADKNLPAEQMGFLGDEPFSIFDAVLDFEMVLPSARIGSEFDIASQSGAHLKVLDRMANIVILHDGETQKESTTIGLLDAKIKKDSVIGGGVFSLFISGIEHILIGWDHVIFVAMIALSSATLWKVAMRATAFTIGHSITLAVGVLGYVPTGAWFIPFVEMAIAATLLYAGVLIMLEKSDIMNSFIVFFVGLIHGLGFSFVLNEVFKEAGGMSVANLIGFNLGIEAGQIIIYALVAPLLLALERVFRGKQALMRGVIATPLALVAAYWMYERAIVLVSSI